MGYANRGMGFETLIEHTNQMYERKGRMFKNESSALLIKYKNKTLKCDVDPKHLKKALSISSKWYARYCRKVNNYYVFTKVKGEVIHLHRLIMNAPKGLQVDHINGNTLDNREKNLRVVTNAQNQQNRTRIQKNNKSGVRGVSWSKQHGKWMAKLTLNYKQIYIGLYDELSDAENAIKYARANMMTHSPEALKKEKFNKKMLGSKFTQYKNNTSGVRGVAWCKRSNKWRVRIQVDNKKIHIGTFEDLEEAKNAATKAYKENLPNILNNRELRGDCS